MLEESTPVPDVAGVTTPPITGVAAVAVELVPLELPELDDPELVEPVPMLVPCANADV